MFSLRQATCALIVVASSSCALYGAFDADFRSDEESTTPPGDAGELPNETEDTGPVGIGGASSASPGDGGTAALTCIDTCPTGRCEGEQCVPWVETIGGVGFSEVRYLDAGPDGEVIVVGSFDGTILVGDETLVPHGEYDVFVAKLTRSGETVWANRVGGPWFDEPRGLAVDSAGDVYVAVRCNGTEFPPAGYYGTMGSDDICVAKYGGGGDVLWVREFGSPYWDTPSDLAVDDSGVYVVGEFDTLITFGSYNLAAMWLGGFVVKLDTESGSPQWARSFTPISYSAIQAVSANQSGDVYIAGRFQTEAQLDGTFLTNADWVDDLFVAKLDAETGTAFWASSIANTDLDMGWADITDMATDDGDVVIAGMMDGSWSFGSGVLSPWGMQGFVARMGPGGAAKWQQHVSGPWQSEVKGVAVDPTGATIFTLSFDGPSASLGAETVVNPSFDGFTFQGALGRITQMGSVEEMRSIGGDGNELLCAPDVAPDTGNLLFGGAFDGFADFGTGPVSALTSDGFLVSYGSF